MEILIQMALDYLQSYPVFGTIIMILGFTRSIMKPLMSLINAIVNQTASPADNQWWAQIQASEGMKMFLYFLDWSTSIKIKPKPK